MNKAAVSRDAASRAGAQGTLLGIAVNAALALIKGTAGIVGHSQALVADAIESTADIFGSLIVFVGLRMAGKPADKNHPYGHGKFEPLATVAVGLMMLGAALLIAVQSIESILTPKASPAPYTLIVLIGVVLVKEFMFRRLSGLSSEIGSSAVRADAWHHRSDAITSAAACIGISISLIGGEGFQRADGIAALFASAIIVANAVLLMRPALSELLDTAPEPTLVQQIRAIAERVEQVRGTHKCHVRKLGFDYTVDLDILLDPNLTIRAGHDIAHHVVDAVRREIPSVSRVFVHVEPSDDYGRRSPPLE